MPPFTELLDRARLAVQQGQFAVAERLAREARDQAPSQPAAWALLAEAQRGQGRLEEALCACAQLVRLSPGSAEAHLQLGRFLLEAGRRQEAAEQLEWALALRPDHVEALLQLGVMLAE